MKKRNVNTVLHQLLQTAVTDETVAKELQEKGVKKPTELDALALALIKESKKSSSILKELLNRTEEEENHFEVKIKVVK